MLLSSEHVAGNTSLAQIVIFPCFGPVLQIWFFFPKCLQILQKLFISVEVLFVFQFWVVIPADNHLFLYLYKMHVFVHKQITSVVTNGGLTYFCV